jgi:ribosome-associated protein
MIEFDLKGHEYIALNNLIKFLALAETGGEANQRIENGEVKVNDQIETQKRKKLRAGDRVLFQNKLIIIK